MYCSFTSCSFPMVVGNMVISINSRCGKAKNIYFFCPESGNKSCVKSVSCVYFMLDVKNINKTAWVEKITWVFKLQASKPK